MNLKTRLAKLEEATDLRELGPLPAPPSIIRTDGRVIEFRAADGAIVRLSRGEFDRQEAARREAYEAYGVPFTEAATYHPVDMSRGRHAVN